MKSIDNLMMAIPIIIFVTLMNVFISTSVAGAVFLQLQAAGYSHSAVISILVAIIVYLYVWLNHKLRSMIK